MSALRKNQIRSEATVFDLLKGGIKELPYSLFLDDLISD